ncbi:MAG: regulatory protein RecX [Candidatus Binatia bacterium]
MKPSRLRSKSVNTPEEALKAALRFLGHRARSEAEITAHLTRKGYSPDLATLALGKLRASRYVGDEGFARDWARSRVDDRGYGPLRIEQELRAKGIDESLILETVRECFGGGHEGKKAKQVLEKQFGREKLDDPKTLRRAAAFLQRRGYSETVILDLLRVHED